MQFYGTITLSNEDLRDVKQNVASFHNHALDREILSQIFSFGNFLVHPPGQAFQLLLRVFQVLAFDVIVRGQC